MGGYQIKNRLVSGSLGVKKTDTEISPEIEAYVRERVSNKLG
jgi:hypothetical protein